MSDSNLIPHSEIVKQFSILQNDEVRVKLDNFNRNIHKEPKQSEIAKHRAGFDYIPIDVLQKKADKYFLGLWKWEILYEPKLIINEIQICGRFHYVHPTLGMWLFRDGVGVAQVRFQSKTDWTVIQNKIQNTLQLDIPHAEAEAMKSAMQKIGDAFGRNLRRELQSEYVPYVPKPDLDEKQKKIFNETSILISEYSDPKEMLKNKDAIINEQLKKSLPESAYMSLVDQFQNHLDKIRG